MAFYELTKRSVLKAISFRILVLSFDALIVYGITRRIDIVLGVVIVTNIVHTVLYIVHERAWDTVHWGRKKK